MKFFFFFFLEKGKTLTKTRPPKHWGAGLIFGERGVGFILGGRARERRRRDFTEAELGI